MSVREFPSVDSEVRQERANECTITDIRVIDGEQFGAPDEYTVYEVDLINDRGETRENVTIIPRILFESTKDVQHRHDYGIVGKYSRALAQESEQAERELMEGVRERRENIATKMRELRAEDSRLLHTQADMEER
jgi:hypothetical protein